MNDKKDQSPGNAPPPESDDDDEKTVLFQPIPETEAAPSDDGPGANVIPDDFDAVTGDAAPAPAPVAPPPVAPAPPAASAPPPPAAASTAPPPPQTAPPVDDDDDDRTVVVTDVRRGTARPQEAPAVTQPPPTTQPAPGEGSGPQTHTNTVSVAPPMPGAAPTPLSSLEPGTVINNMYKVEERLDQGGMGSVFRGSEISTGENVAIKVILPEMAEDDKVTAMFKREARTMRQLHHDAIVRY
ncbi:MAG: protein kinase, partial [Pseudomonadota bacterium]